MHLFTLKQSKQSHSRDFLVPPKLESSKADTPWVARIQRGGEGTGREVPPTFHGNKDFP